MKLAWRTARDAEEDEHREQEAQLCYAKTFLHHDLSQQ
jgi:hypothetical protein